MEHIGSPTAPLAAIRCAAATASGSVDQVVLPGWGVDGRTVGVVDTGGGVDDVGLAVGTGVGLALGFADVGGAGTDVLDGLGGLTGPGVAVTGALVVGFGFGVGFFEGEDVGSELFEGFVKRRGCLGMSCGELTEGKK
jgi:hypothetical protein